MIVQPFPSFFPLGTMASADFLTFVVTMFRFEYVYSFSPTRPPRVSVTTFASYICCIYTLKFGQYWTSFCYGNSSVSSMPYMQFLFVRPRLCLRLPSDSTSRWTPLPLANSSYCQVCSGLSPPSDSACRAHIKKAGEVLKMRISKPLPFILPQTPANRHRNGRSGTDFHTHPRQTCR